VLFFLGCEFQTNTAGLTLAPLLKCGASALMEPFLGLGALASFAVGVL
jgi:hypothetical protein